jgi:P-type Cu+ transporter
MATEVVQFKVSGLMCSFCTMSVETALKRYPSIKNVMVNLVHGIVLVEAETSGMKREDIAHAIEKLGYSVSASETQQYNTDDALFKLIKQRGIIGMVLAFIDLLVDPLNIFSLSQQHRSWFSLAVASFVLFWVGYPILKKTLLAIGQRVINANVLLSAGAWGSYTIGILSIFYPQWPNFLPVAAWLMSLHLFFGYFKLDTRKKASEAVRKLLNLQPSKARVRRGDEVVEVLTQDVIVGEIIEVRPGDRIPLDGIVVEGSGSVDESSFTGESNPAFREINAQVIGGSLNLDGSFKIKVTKISQDSFLSQIVRLMSQISDRKPPIELLADKLMNYYGPVVFIVAGLAFSGWLVFTGNFQYSVLVLLTTIIMGYPCALGITTPMLAAIAGGKGISIGLLVKASEVFHGLSKVNTIVFDKTGTLTYGKPTVTNVIPIGVSESEVLSIAASAEEKSEHPLAQAIFFYAKKHAVNTLSVRDFRALPGKGINALIGQDAIVIGNPRFFHEQNIHINNDVADKVSALGREGKTVVLIAKNKLLIGLIGLQDTPRPATDQVIQRMKARGFRTVMLTGDAKPVAEAIGAEIGIDEVKSELLPIDKVKAIEDLQAQGKKVVMVGDGINDAPALAQSDVGIAIGAGTDVAIESAGVILISDKLIDVLNSVTLGKMSYRIMTGNVVVAVVFNIIGMLMAALGYVTPMLAIVFMIASIFAILINTLRVRSVKLDKIDNNTSGAFSQINYKVSNMVCEGCAEKITEILTKLNGVDQVKPKVMQKQVLVSYNPHKISDDQIKQALTTSGYNAIEN